MTSAIEGGRPWPRGVEKACPELEVVAPEEAVDPVVDGLTADLERLGDLLGGEPLGEPEHRLGTTPLLGRRGPEHEVFQFPTQASTQDDRSHRVTPLDPWCLDDRFYLSKNFLSGPDHSFSRAPHGEPGKQGENGGRLSIKGCLSMIR